MRSIAVAAAAARSLLLDSDSRLRLSVVVAFPQGGAQVIERVDAPRVADAAGVEGARRAIDRYIVRSLVPVGSRRISEINRFFSRRARSVADLRPSFFAREQGVRASRSARSAPWRCRERWKPPGGRCGSGSGDETNGGSIEAEGGWKKVAATFEGRDGVGGGTTGQRIDRARARGASIANGTTSVHARRGNTREGRGGGNA